MEIRRQLHSPSEVAGALLADPEGLGAGRAVALAAQMAAEAGDPTEHGWQRWRDDWRGLAMDGDVDGPPFGRVQHGVAGQLGGVRPSTVKYRIRQAMMRYKAKAGSKRSRVLSCKASTRQPGFKILKNTSIYHP